MGNRIRTYDSNIRRKSNKELTQSGKNLLEKSYTNYIAVVTKLNTGPEGHESKWCEVKLIPTLSYKEFSREEGYVSVEVIQNEKANVFIPVDVSISLRDIVLVNFTDVNFRKTILSILNGLPDTETFIEKDQTKKSINFGIITNRILNAQ